MATNSLGLAARSGLVAVAAGCLVSISVVTASAEYAVEPEGVTKQAHGRLAAVGRSVLLQASAPVIRVTNATQLASALANARPGQTIDMADGRYAGRFTTSRSGTAAAPITLRGSSYAVLDGGSVTTGYALRLRGADYWRLEGFSVTGAQKGIMLDGTNNTILSSLDVGNVGMEAVHFRNFSSGNVLQNSRIHHTGKYKAGYGEGVYIGSAESDWPTISGGRPDASNGNRVLNNVIFATTAESIDVKEGTYGGLIERNTLDGSGITGDNFADSLIDVKGTHYQIVANSAFGASVKVVDVFQTHRIIGDSGQFNVFALNQLYSMVPGYGINIHIGPNEVSCSNTAPAALRGLSNVACT